MLKKLLILLLLLTPVFVIVGGIYLLYGVFKAREPEQRSSAFEESALGESTRGEKDQITIMLPAFQNVTETQKAVRRVFHVVLQDACPPLGDYMQSVGKITANWRTPENTPAFEKKASPYGWKSHMFSMTFTFKQEGHPDLQDLNLAGYSLQIQGGGGTKSGYTLYLDQAKEFCGMENTRPGKKDFKSVEAFEFLSVPLQNWIEAPYQKSGFRVVFKDYE